MKAILINQKQLTPIGSLNLTFLPRENEWIEFNGELYSVYKVIHTEKELKIRVFNK